MSRSNRASQDDPAREAYIDAVAVFTESLGSSSRVQALLDDKVDMLQVHEAVISAKKAYEMRSPESKTRQWLSKLSSCIVFYSSVLDMMAQHHPEYVALVWGAMKFFLVGLLNHEELIKQVSKALVQIAEVLPRIDIKISLYPSEEMSRAVTTVYVSILQLLQQAAGWYSEGKVKHFVSSIIRPYELRFKDLVDDIARSSRQVDQLAFTASQKELKELHTEHKELCATIIDLKRFVTESQALNYRGFLDSSRRICEIQLSQILSFTSNTRLTSPEDELRFCQSRSNRRRPRMTLQMCPQWLSPNLHNWASTEQSSLLLVKGSLLRRHETKDFATDMVSLLRDIDVPVVWTLGAPLGGEKVSRSPIDVLKHLVFQVLQINLTLLNAKSSALNAARFQAARTEKDWFDILASVVVGLPYLYIILDAGLLETELYGDVKWPEAFNNMLDGLSKSCPTTAVKVILLSYGSNPFLESPFSDEIEDRTVYITGPKRQSSPWNRKRVPKGFGGASRKPFSHILKPVIFLKPQISAPSHIF